MVRTWYFHCRGMSSVPDWGTKIPQAAWCGKKKKISYSIHRVVGPSPLIPYHRTCLAAVICLHFLWV